MIALQIQKSRLASRVRQGFTLIEVLLVMVILVVLASIILPKYVGRTEQAKITKAKADISTINTQLAVFETDNSRYPTTEEGLNALVERPSADMADWKQLLDKAPMDPWNHPYIYRCPGTSGTSFDLYSAGPNGQDENGGGDDIRP